MPQAIQYIKHNDLFGRKLTWLADEGATKEDWFISKIKHTLYSHDYVIVH